jgi:purine catabolism regulator
MTVRDLLRLFPTLRLLTGEAAQNRPLRWVQVVEQPDIAEWLRRGDLVLTSGVSWPAEPAAQRRLIRDLAAAGVVGILFATGRFLARVPEVALAEAERLGLAVLEAPFELRFADISETAQRIIVGEHFEVMEKASEIHQALAQASIEAADLGDIARRLTLLMPVTVTILGPDRRLLAHTGPEAPRAVERLAFWLEAAARATEPVRAEVDGGDLLLLAIRIGDEVTGYLILAPIGGRLGLLEERVIQHAGAVLALHLLRQRSVAEVERRVHASFLETLLQGLYRAGDRAAEERVRLQGFDPGGDFRILVLQSVSVPAVANVRQVALDRRLLEEVEAAAASLGRPVMGTLLGHRLVVLWPAREDDPARLAELHRRLEAAVRQPVVLAVGGAHAGLAAIPRSHAEAEWAAETATEDGRLVFYEQNLTLRVLAEAGPALGHELVESVFGRIASERNGAELIRTLEVLVAVDGNQAEAAQRLGVHRNTVRLRQERIEEILGGRLADPELGTRVHLAILARRLWQRRGDQFTKEIL